MKSMKNAAIAALMAAVLLLAGTNVYASGNPWYDEFVSYESAHGSDYTLSTDAAFLAWQESYMLRSYLNMYDLTKDTAWLTKFTNHFDTVQSTASDSDGDGYDDWTSARYSPNLVANSKFETGDSSDATLPADWNRSGSTASTVFRTNAAGTFVSGGACSNETWGMGVTTDGSGTKQRLYQAISGYEPNHRYLLSVAGKNSGSVDGRAFVYDRTTNSLLASVTVSASNWTTYTADFTTPASGHQLEIWLDHFGNSPAGSVAYFDNVSITGYYSYIITDAMIGIPVANFVRLVNQNSAALSSFQSKADTYEAFLEDEIIAKWEDSSAYYGNTWVNASSTEGYYKEPANHDTFSTSTAFDPLPYNQYFSLIEVQRILYDVNGNTSYLDKALKGATYFKNRLETDGDAYIWYYSDFSGSKREDASHGNIDMEFILEMFNAGDVFTGSDMDKFANTLTDNLWNQSASAPELHNLVTGVQGGYCSDYSFSTIMYGWTPLAQFDAQAWQIAADQYSAPGFAIGKHTEALTQTEIMKWDPVKLTNQGFELASSSDPTLPARWTRLLSTASTAYLDSANSHSGNYGLTLVSNGTTWQKAEQLWQGFEPSADYVLTFDGKTDTSTAKGRVWVYDETTSTTLASYNFDHTNWQTHSFTFTAPSNASDVVHIQLGHQNYTITGGKTYFDNVSLNLS